MSKNKEEKTNNKFLKASHGNIGFIVFIQKALSILKQYDDGNLRRQKKGKAKFALKTEDCRQIIKS